MGEFWSRVRKVLKGTVSAVDAIWVIGFVFLLIFMLLTTFGFYFPEDRIGQADEVVVYDRAEVTVDGVTKVSSLPVKLENLQPRTPVTVELDVKTEPNKSIQVRSAFAPLKVYVNGNLTYEFGTDGTRPAYMKDPGTMIHMIGLKENGTVRVRLEYLSPVTRNNMTIPSILWSNQSGILRYNTKLMGIGLFEAAILFVSGLLLSIIALFVIPIEKRGTLMLWAGLFAIATGVWGASNCDLTLFYFNNPNLLYLTSYIGFFTLVLPLGLFLEEMIDYHHKKIFRVLRNISMLAILVAMLLQFTGILMFNESVRFFQIYQPLAIAFLTCSVVYEAICYKNKVAGYLSIAMAIMLLAVVLELASYGRKLVYTDSSFYLTGAVIFCLMMSFAGAVQIRHSVFQRRKQVQQDHELLLMRRELNEQRKYQDTIVEHEDALRKQRHDYRHHLTVLQEYSRNGMNDKIDQYISELLGDIVTPQSIRYCDNMTVNAVCAYYVGVAEKLGVEPEIRLVLPKDVTKEMEKDLCIIFGNLLENACEAIRKAKTEDGEMKKRPRNQDREYFIRLHALTRKGHLIIRMENSAIHPTKRWGRYFISDKTGNVGIGLTSIAGIADKENGDASFKQEGETFVSEIYLSVPAEKKAES